MKSFTIIILSCLCIAACSTPKHVVFADEAWSFSHLTGDMVNADSTLRLSFGDHILDPNMTIISNSDSIEAHPGSDKYIARILNICNLKNAEVYFFSPLEKVMWVKLPENYRDIKPRSISHNLMSPRPETSWIWDDDAPEGNRKPEEIYTNIFVDKKNCTLIVVDKLNYGNIPMACLHIYQSANKYSSELGFYPWYWTCNGNLLDHSCAEIIAHWIDSRRQNIFNNYRLGQNFKLRKKVNSIKDELKEIYISDQSPRNELISAWRDHPHDTILHRQIGRKIWQNDSVNILRATKILDEYDLIFGEENEILWAVIQHGTLDLQKKYLDKFIVAAQNNHIRKEMVAMMQDRITCRENKPQIFGTQGSYNEQGIFVPAPIQCPDSVDIRRASMGMEPLQEYINKMNLR